MFCQLNLISKKGPNAKLRKNAKNYQTLNNFSSLVSLTRHFTKFTLLEQLTAMPQFNMQNMCFFFFFSKQSSLYESFTSFVPFSYKNIIIYWLILTVNHQGHIFLFLYLHPVGQSFLYPSKFCNHLKHSAKS